VIPKRQQPAPQRRCTVFKKIVKAQDPMRMKTIR